MKKIARYAKLSGIAVLLTAALVFAGCKQAESASSNYLEKNTQGDSDENTQEDSAEDAFESWLSEPRYQTGWNENLETSFPGKNIDWIASQGKNHGTANSFKHLIHGVSIISGVSGGSSGFNFWSLDDYPSPSGLLHLEVMPDYPELLTKDEALALAVRVNTSLGLPANTWRLPIAGEFIFLQLMNNPPVSGHNVTSTLTEPYWIKDTIISGGTRDLFWNPICENQSQHLFGVQGPNVNHINRAVPHGPQKCRVILVRKTP